MNSTHETFLLTKLQAHLDNLQLANGITLAQFIARIATIREAHIEVVTAPLPGAYSGLCVHDGQRNYRICCNTYNPTPLLELTVLHELYHILLGHVEAKPPTTLAAILDQFRSSPPLGGAKLPEAVICRNLEVTTTSVADPQEVEVELLACLTQQRLIPEPDRQTPIDRAMNQWFDKQ